MLRSMAGRSLFVLALAMGFNGLARTVEVTSCTNGVVSLAFGEADGKACRLMVGRGAVDAGSNPSAWEAFEEIGTVAADATSLTYAFPEGEHRFARFFLVAAEQPVVKRLAYIQSTGSQYIDTGVRARTPVRAVLDMATVGVSEDKTILGARKSTGDTRFFLAHRYGMSDGYAYVVQALNTWSGYLGKKVRDKNRYQNFESYIGTPARTVAVRDADGAVSQAAVSSSIDTGLNLYLFAANMYGSPGQFANVRIYGCKIWLDGVLQRDFYPAEDATGAAGLYDAVSHTFFKNKGSGTFTKGPEIAFEPRIFPVAVASDVVTIRAPGALVGKWDFGAGALNTLPLPEGVLENSPWTMKFRFKVPSSGSGKRTIFKLDGADGVESEMFVDGSGKIGYGSTSTTFAVTAGVWHTLTVAGGPARWDAYLDERRIAYRNGSATTFFNGHASILLGATIDFSCVEIWKEGGAGEARLEQFTKDGLTGEWTFPAMNPLRAAKGRDLERCNLTFDGTFAASSLADGTVLGDTGVRLPTYHGYRCYHGLPLDASYSVVMDVRVPSDADVGKLRAVFQPSPYHNTDSSFFLRTSAGQSALEAWVASGTWVNAGFDVETWARCVVTYKHGDKKTLYVNGQKIDARVFDRMKVTGDSFYFGLDNDTWGSIEDYAIDIGYAAIYSRVLTDAEVAELHARPTAHTGATDTTVPTVSPAGVWEKEGGVLVARQGEALAALGNGAYSWTRSTAPAAATYVADLTLPMEQTAGGTFVANANGVATGIYGTAGLLNGSLVTTTDASIFAPGTDWTGSADWGYWTYQPLQRGGPVRVAVVWSRAGHVTYYENGRLRAQLEPTAARSLATPTRTMTFFAGLGADVTRLVAYDVALTPFEIASLGVMDLTPVENAAPVAAIAPPVMDVYSVLDQVPFTASFTDEDGDWAMMEIDYGDGTLERSPSFVIPGRDVAFSHLYSQVGTYTPRARAVSQNGQTGAWTSGRPITIAFVGLNVDNLLLTRPWQQNVYTNRFTIMVEMNREIEGLQLQYAEDYAQTVAMTGVCAPAGNTWIYKGRVTLNGHPGEAIPYRIVQRGLPFNGTRALEMEGMVKLWPMDDDESFSCSVWGDNQQGARAGDWDVAPYLYVTRLFEHMMARDVDFGICTGDMASSANYATQIKPLVLDRTDVIFGSTKPYYVAWGNHDTAYANNKPYFETPAIDDPSYRMSEKGNSYLYRGNVLFILLDDSVCTTSATKTWLAKLLSTPRARAAKFRIVFHHVPIYTEVSGSMERTLEQTFINGGVDLVLGGHMHGYERLFFSGVTYVVNGCAGYLDHPLSVVHNWGDASVVGGHRDVPFLWARQSLADRNVLGAAEPVRMGMLMGYGELAFKGNELIYRAFGFNADGSYIGVFDAFRLTSKTVAAPAVPAGNAPVCADPASFAAFTAKPVTNAKWKEYADAAGLAFTYPDEAANAPVTDVSKTEIEAFLAWLNGSTGTYRLPTAGELAAAFNGNFAREISEWTSTVDAARGRCRILGGPACAVPGTWARAADRPEVLSADCSATYLGFRLATGKAPAESDTLAAAAALALGSGDTGVYEWVSDGRGGSLVPITTWNKTGSGPHTFDAPVVFTGTGTFTHSSNRALTLNGGLVMPRATGFKKSGTGALTIRGPVRVGPTVGSSAAELAGFVFTSNGSLTLDNVTFTGTAAAFRTVDKKVYLAGTNDFSSAALAFNASSVTDLVLATGVNVASLAVRSIRQYTENANAAYGIGAGVTVTCAEDVKVAQALYVIDGKLDAGAVNATGNNGPYFQGAGTLALGYLGSFENSWTRWELTNVVFTTARPIRNNVASSRNRHQVEGASTRFAATCDWSIGPRDELNMPVEWSTDLLRTPSPRLVFDTLDPMDGTTAHTFEFSPNLANGAWGFTKVNPGTLVLKGAYANTGAIRVEGGVLRLAGETSLASGDFSVGPAGMLELAGTSTVERVVFAGGTLAPHCGARWTGNLQGPYTVAEPAGEVLTLAFGSLFTGKATLANGTPKFRLSYAFENRAALGVAYPVLVGSALTAEQVEVTADLDPQRFTPITCVNRAGDVDLVMMPVEARAAWGSDAVYIFGTFTPQGGYSARFELQNGATLNLREKTAAWPIEGTGPHTTPLAFADNAMITVDVAERNFAKDEKIVSWTAAPENLSTLKFTFGTTVRYCSSPRVAADGIWVRPFKQLILFR